MACGKPVVGYRHGGVCEMVMKVKTVFLLHRISLAELSKAIQELAGNTEKRNNLVRPLSNAKRTLSLQSYIL